jgi:hypothetical protein
MDVLELIFTMLSERVTTEISKEEKPFLSAEMKALYRQVIEKGLIN